MIDISRDPRWGRIAESLGEDPLLTSIMDAAMVRGFQGDDLSNPTSLASCAKHFAGYGAAEAGKDYNTTWIPETQLRDVYLPSFKAAVDAGAASFMCSFNDINGVPSSGNIHLNDDILRKEWGYDGVLVSDWASIEQMIPHGVVGDLKEAANLSLTAKVDMDMMGFAYVNHLEELVKEGKITEKQIDESVRNILRMKFRLGLFDNPYTKIPVISPFYSEDAIAKARKAAVESTVLLKNDGILPIDAEKTKTIAVAGPMSDAPADQLGTWIFDGEPERSITPQMAFNNLSVMLGGGNEFVSDDMKQHFKNTGTTLIQNDRNAMLNFNGEKVWALFQDRAMSYDLDRNPAEEPSVSEMTEKAIEVLNKNPNGFFLMVEGSKVDWAANANDPAGIIGEYLAFDKAVGKAIEFAKKDGNTTVVILPDHGNSGFSIGRNGMKRSYSK